MTTYFPDTPEKGKASHYSGESRMRDGGMHPGSWKSKSSRGEMLMQGWVMHPGSWKSKSLQW